MPPLNSEVQHQGNPLLDLMINLHPGRVDVDEGKVAAAGALGFPLSPSQVRRELNALQLSILVCMGRRERYTMPAVRARTRSASTAAWV